MTEPQRRSVIGIIASLLIGGLVILAGSDGSTQIGPIAVFAVCGLVAYAINWIAFVPAMRAQTERYYDLTGSLTYLTVTAMALLLSENLDTRAVIVAALVIVWAPSWSGACAGTGEMGASTRSRPTRSGSS